MFAGLLRGMSESVKGSVCCRLEMLICGMIKKSSCFFIILHYQSGKKSWDG